MLNIQYIMPYHPQYHRPPMTHPSPKEDTTDSKKSFHDILSEKMNKRN